MAARSSGRERCDGSTGLYARDVETGMHGQAVLTGEIDTAASAVQAGETDVDVSSFAIPEQADLKTSPVVRTLSQNVSTRPPLGRPTLLSSVDDVNSRKRTQVEVTVTRVK